MDLGSMSLQEVEHFLAMTGKRGAMTLSVLGKLVKHFESVFSTEVGQTLLLTDINRMSELLFKIAEETATDQEKAEFRFLWKIRIPSVTDKIREYLKQVEEVKKVVNIK